MNKSAVTLIAIALAAACSGDRAVEPVRIAERDSAGIRIVENAIDTAALRSGWSVGETPMLVIGGIEAEESQQLYGVSGGVRLEDGRIVIADIGSHQIRVYNADGSLASAFGREGEGPGEYQRPTLAGRGAGDSLIVFDAGLRRVTLLTPDSGAARSFDVGSEGGGFPLVLGTLAGGAIAMGGGMAFSSAEGFPSGLVRPKSRYVIAGPDGELTGDFGEMPAAEMWAEVQSSGFRARPVPFGKVTAAMPASDRMWIGTGESWEVRAYRPDATLERIVRFDRSLRPVTDRLRDAWLDERLEDIEDADEVRQQRAELSNIPAPETVAPYQLFRTDRLDNLWIGETVLPREDRRTWTITDPDGRAIGRLTLPPRTLPLDIGADYVLAVTRDEFDVEAVTLWTLNRP